jgi:hypothetical protein
MTHGVAKPSLGPLEELDASFGFTQPGGKLRSRQDRSIKESLPLPRKPRIKTLRSGWWSRSQSEPWFGPSLLPKKNMNFSSKPEGGRWEGKVLFTVSDLFLQPWQARERVSGSEPGLSLPLCLLLLLLWKEVKEAKISSCSYRRGRRAQTRAESF